MDKTPLEVIVLVLDFSLSTLNKLKQYDTVRNIHNSVASGFLFSNIIIFWISTSKRKIVLVLEVVIVIENE